MAWERRKRGGLYYTRSRRVGGRVVREYLGKGETAHLLAALDEFERRGRLLARQERQDEQDRLEAIQSSLRSLGDALDAVLVPCLEAKGYHRHKGQWRRRRRAC